MTRFPTIPKAKAEEVHADCEDLVEMVVGWGSPILGVSHSWMVSWKIPQEFYMDDH